MIANVKGDQNQVWESIANHLFPSAFFKNGTQVVQVI